MEIKITRQTVIAGKGPVYVGEVYDVDTGTAKLLMNMGKAVPHAEKLKKLTTRKKAKPKKKAKR